jgi:hypothetical protein
MSNLDLVSRRETVVNPGMNDKLEKKKHLSECGLMTESHW